MSMATFLVSEDGCTHPPSMRAAVSMPTGMTPVSVAVVCLNCGYAEERDVHGMTTASGLGVPK